MGDSNRGNGGLHPLECHGFDDKYFEKKGWPGGAFLRASLVVTDI